MENRLFLYFLFSKLRWWELFCNNRKKKPGIGLVAGAEPGNWCNNLWYHFITVLDIWSANSSTRTRWRWWRWVPCTDSSHHSHRLNCSLLPDDFPHTVTESPSNSATQYSIQKQGVRSMKYLYSHRERPSSKQKCSLKCLHEIVNYKVNVMVGCGMQSNTNINKITQQLEFEVVTGCSPDCSSQTSHSRNHWRPHRISISKNEIVR